MTAFPKSAPIRSGSYRRLVAQLPCISCGIEGYSQAAHPPPKGKGIKESDDECFPLCCTRPMIQGCHADFDQYRLIPKEKMRVQAAEWGERTMARINVAGQLAKETTSWK